MLSAYSCVGAVLEDKALLERAAQAANFLKENLWDAERQTVLRSCYRGEDMELQQISPPISGFLDDYAFLVSGLLDLYEASLQTQWLQWAEQLQLRQDVLFWDQQDGGYFCSDPKTPPSCCSSRKVGR
ncbi:spermatogenesis-associated protein 20-like [Notothenia coriiceps]|uniref:Spermatogenesis-associated protein 20-like n=1 Tax=Notothenia coriiceps TaxID=8208 RepID=A0A6I9NV61_9TELE|nr:PREDICTED: spermatogenesis-associated protein 20-like [Notothenia coriiceps]